MQWCSNLMDLEVTEKGVPYTLLSPCHRRPRAGDNYRAPQSQSPRLAARYPWLCCASDDSTHPLDPAVQHQIHNHMKYKHIFHVSNEITFGNFQ